MNNIDNHMNNSIITPESVLASVREMFAISRVEDERRRNEDERRNAEFAQKLKESKDFFDALHAKHAKEMAELRLAQKETNKHIGGIQRSNGEMAEDFFFNAISCGNREMFGETFYDIVRNDKITANRGFDDEYDILMINGQAVCIVEVKYKADSEALTQKVLRKAVTFRENYHKHSGKKLYLALASMSFHPLTEQECINNGIAIIKQLGDTFIVNDNNVRIF